MGFANYKYHEKIGLLIVKTGGSFSMIASYLIMRDITFKYHTGERIRLTAKIVFVLSVANFFASFFSAFMSNWMVPEYSGLFMASGTTASCTAQGFLDTFFYGVCVFMDAILAGTYCLIVKRGMKDEIKTRKSYYLVFVLPQLVVLCCAIMPLFDDAYNYTDSYFCSIGPYPLGCLKNGSSYPCTRGSEAKRMKIASFAFVFTANIIVVFSVVNLIRFLMFKDRKMGTYSSDASTILTVQTTKKTWQGIWYITAFMISWVRHRMQIEKFCVSFIANVAIIVLLSNSQVPWYIWQFFSLTSDMRISEVNTAFLLYILAFTRPTQGVWNACVYFRPKYLKYRQRDKTELRLASILRVLRISVPKFLNVEWWNSIWAPNANFDHESYVESK